VGRKIELVTPVASSVQMVDKSGRLRTFGAGRHKTSLRIREEHWAWISEREKALNTYKQTVIDEILEAGIKAIETKEKRRKK